MCFGNSQKLLRKSFKVKEDSKVGNGIQFLICCVTGSEGHSKKDSQKHLSWQYQINICPLKRAVLIVKTYLDVQFLVFIKISFVYIAVSYYSLFKE